MPDPQNQDSTASSRSPSLQDGLTQFLKAKSKGDKSGNYRRNANRVITRWIDWLKQREITNFEQLDETVLAHYAEYLRRRVAAKESETTDGGIARSTAWTYYNTISAFLGWASKWGYIGKLRPSGPRTGVDAGPIDDTADRTAVLDTGAARADP